MDLKSVDPPAEDMQPPVPEGEASEAGNTDPDQQSETGALPEDEEAGGPEKGKRKRKPGPGADLSDEELLAQLMALMFASPEPLTYDKINTLLRRPGRVRGRATLEQLVERIKASGLPLQVCGLKGGVTLLTTSDMSEVVQRLAKGSSVERISPAALETLAVVAYRQPVTKAEIEAIRGVQAGPLLRSLVDRALIKVVGRADVPGHPLQYGTTPDFLDRFGLMSLEDLPRDSELARD